MGVVNIAVLACIEDNDCKKVVNFLKEKGAPPEKILATPRPMRIV